MRLTSHELYGTWNQMRHRCENQNNKNYHLYGARGIKFYEPWRKFLRFVEDIENEIGSRPLGKTLDRFPNKFGNYEPGNVRWATVEEQSRNKGPYRSGKFFRIRLHQGKWEARAAIVGKVIHVGRYQTRKEAVKNAEAALSLLSVAAVGLETDTTKDRHRYVAGVWNSIKYRFR